mgnify:FL=1
MRRILLCVFLAFPLFAWAEETSGTLVRLQAQSQREVANDLMEAVMSSEQENRDAAVAADTVNKALQEAKSAVAKFPNIKLSSGQYHSYPVYHKTDIIKWRVRGEIKLEGRDFEAMARVIALLQSRLQLNGVNFGVSLAARRSAENELINEAIAAFRERAALVQRALGGSLYTIKEINLNTGGAARPPIPLRMKAMTQSLREDAVAEPVTQPGTSEITVSAEGSILIPTR